MPGVSIKYRTDGAWGSGLGRNLTPAEFDANLYALAQAIVAIQSSPPTPNDIASISVAGTSMNITLTDGTVLGPLPLPVLKFNWRGPWTAATNYAVLDTFIVDGSGIYTTIIAHTSGSAFDPNIEDSDSNPCLTQLFGFDPNGADTTYDVGFFYAGRLADQTTGYLYQEYLLRKISIPLTNAHNAYLQEPAAGTLVLPVLYNDAQVGTITFASGGNTGDFAWSTGALTIDYRERLAVGLPTTADATAAGLSVGFGAVKVLS